MNAQPHDIAAVESLLAFWRDAGVDACYGDAPVDHTHVAPPPAVKAVQKATASVVMPLAGVNAEDAIAEARRLAAGAATLQDLAAAVAAFEGCPLRGMGATQSVFGRGNPNASVLIIGEGPGGDEDRIGQPFVGKAGQLLDRMLAAAGLTDKVFITNTVFWRPPGNRTPSPQEQAVCAPFVERQFDREKAGSLGEQKIAITRFVAETKTGESGIDFPVFFSRGGPQRRPRLHSPNTLAKIVSTCFR